MKHIYIIGDSTAAKKLDSKRPESGWGEYLHLFMHDYAIENHAQNGRSSKSFYDEGLFMPVLDGLTNDDLLLIQFGHNDSKSEDPKRYTDKDMYESYLSLYIDQARNKGAIPILISSVTRRTFINHQLDPRACGLYPSYMKEVATKKKCLFIDMFQMSQNLLKELGEEKSKDLYLYLDKQEHINYPLGVTDNTHFSPQGALIMAEMIAKEIKKIIK
jgi:lysophospholipase L1-like esterase